MGVEFYVRCYKKKPSQEVLKDATPLWGGVSRLLLQEETVLRSLERCHPLCGVEFHVRCSCPSTLPPILDLRAYAQIEYYQLVSSNKRENSTPQGGGIFKTSQDSLLVAATVKTPPRKGVAS